MYLMYVDESGDIGLENSPTRYFVLSGIVIHELRWADTLDRLIDFRRRMRADFGLRLREEIHAAALINRPGNLIRIKRHDRLKILRLFADELASNPDLNVLNVVVDKYSKSLTYDVFENAWRALIQRFENTIAQHNFSGPTNADERGMIFPDFTDVRKLIDLIRKMRRYNPIPNQPQFGLGYRNMKLLHIIEDPNFRDSGYSYFIQAADLVAFLLYQSQQPNGYMRRKGGNNYFNRLESILCKVASSHDPLGIVRL